MCWLLVTPTGDWIRESSREFLALLGDLHPDYDAVMFAVRNLGFVAEGGTTPCSN
jgi:hypothetical protein